MLKQFFYKASQYKAFLAILAALYASLVLGFSPIVIRLSELGPFTTAFYRLFLSFPFLMAWMIIDNVKDPKPKILTTKQDYFLVLGSGVFLAGDLSFWYLSMHNTTVINATLLNNLTVVFVPLLGWLFFKERPSIHLVIGIICALMGSSILVGYSFSFQAQNIVGDLYGLISSIFYSFYMLTVKKLCNHFRISTILTWSAIPIIYILGFLSYYNGEEFFPKTREGWIWLFVLAFVIHILGQSLLTYAMVHLSASVSALILSISPAFAALFAWIIINEPLTIQQGIGGLIVLLGIIIARETNFLRRLKFLRLKEKS